MKHLSALKFVLPFLVVAFAFMSCDDNNPVGTFGDVAERIPNAQLIDGADNVTMNVNYDRDRSYFRISVNNVSPHSGIPNGVYNAWCVELGKPLSRGEDLTGAKLYSMTGDASYNKLTYIINNRYHLERQNPGLSWREIQVAFWAILETRDMNVASIANRLPSYVEGYNETIVNNIIDDVKQNGSTFTPGVGHTHLILMDAGDDEQLTVGESNTAWARMNGGPDGPDDDFTFAFNPDNGDESSVGGGNWATYIKFTNDGSQDEFPLYAGQTNFVGWLNVSRENDELVIEFDLNEGIVLSITHVHVGLEFPDDFPTTNNTWENPQLGQFDYGNSYEDDPSDEWPDSDEVRIEWTWDDNQELLIAAHAVVWEVEEL